MKLRIRTTLPILLAALIGVPVASSLLDAEAQARPKGPGERQEERQDRREERQDRREERREDRQERREDRQERRRDRRQARRQWAAGARAAWKAKQVHRRRLARRALVRRWGEIYKTAPVQAELAAHAWRSARLERMRYLAEKAGNEELLKKIDELEGKEDARHEAHMEQLKSGGGADGGAATEGSAAAAAPAATAEAATE